LDGKTKEKIRKIRRLSKAGKIYCGILLGEETFSFWPG
jgi:hypothetical protein